MEAEEERINKEIQCFLAKTVRAPEVKEEPKPASSTVQQPGASEAKELVNTLLKLQETYARILDGMQRGDEDGIRNEILRSDIKMSLVCESLVRVLRETYVERNEFAKAAQDTEEKAESVSRQGEEMREKIAKLENEVKYAAQTSNELERFLRDQKANFDSFRHKFEAQKRELESLRLMNGEMEASRKILVEKCDVRNVEIETLRGHIDDRVRVIEEMRSKTKGLEDACRTLQEKNSNLVCRNEALLKKLEVRTKNLEVVNSELARLLRREVSVGTPDPSGALDDTVCRAFDGENADDTILKYKSIKGKYKKLKKRLARKAKSYSKQVMVNEQDLQEISRLRKAVDALGGEKAKESEGNKKLVEDLVRKIEGSNGEKL